MMPWNAEDLTIDEERFRGTARLFPLPDLVMFPHVMQPLHIFEPRYCDLLNAALDSDGLIAMSMLAPGWESDYEGRPPLNPYACLGKIVTHQRQSDGHYNVLLLGLRRIRIDQELPADRSYREANVSLLDDYYYPENDEMRSALQAELTEKFQDSLPQEAPANPNVEEMLSSEIPLGVLTDLVSFAVPLDLKTKCELLGESDIDQRAKKLLAAMHESEERGQPKPRGGGYLPPFSTN
ncbi:MAG: LON peptidase substrate-binding domain-containing protein [Planctomycetota bacterium]